MTEVLLINPSLTMPNPEARSFATLEGVRPPLAILALGSYLKSKGHRVRLIDVNPHGLIGSRAYLDEVAAAVTRKPVCVGLSVMTAQIPNAYLISRYIKELNPALPVIWGGAHPTLYPAQTSKSPLVDVAVHGPGEATLLELVRCLENGGGGFDDVGSIAREGKVNPTRKPLQAAELPFLDYDLLDTHIYVSHRNHFLFQKDVRMLPLLASRGCPYRCAFCINSTCRNGWRGQAPARLADEVKVLTQKYRLDAVRFLDENFFTSRRRTREIIRQFQEKGIKVLWGTNTRANFFREDHINLEVARELKEVGFSFASIGAESFSERVLKLIAKDITRRDILNSARVCHQAGIVPVYSWMSGIPGQTKEEISETINAIRRIKQICPPSIHYSLSIYRPFPGGSLYEVCRQQGLNEPESLEGWLNGANFDLTLGSLPMRRFPWIKDKDFVTFTANYTGQIVGKLSEQQNLADYLYAAAIKLRYKLGFFRWPNTEDRLASFIGRWRRKLRHIWRSN